MKLLTQIITVILVAINWTLFVYTVGTADKSYVYLLWALLPVSIGVVWMGVWLDNKGEGNG
jgi:EamA domain-containing membrane protein RarD